MSTQGRVARRQLSIAGRQNGVTGRQIIIAFTIALAFATARALRERNAAERVTALLVEMFSTNTSQSAIGSAATASELLDRGAERIRRELADQPDLQAKVLDAIGAIDVGLGLPDKAPASCRSRWHAGRPGLSWIRRRRRGRCSCWRRHCASGRTIPPPSRWRAQRWRWGVA